MVMSPIKLITRNWSIYQQNENVILTELIPDDENLNNDSDDNGGSDDNDGLNDNGDD